MLHEKNESEMNQQANELEHDACEGCALHHSRRDFIVGSVVAAFGLISINWVDALARNGSAVSYAIPAANGAQIDKNNEVILVRWENEVYAFALSCPHQKTALRWEEQNNRFQCPKHHSKYQPNGTFISGRATRNMDRYSISRQGNNVVVDMNALHKSDVDPNGWKSAVIELGSS